MREIKQVKATMGGSTVQAEVGIYGGRSQAFLESVLPELLKKETRLAGASSSADQSLALFQLSSHVLFLITPRVSAWLTSFAIRKAFSSAHE
uniref:Uncharacterized protein n=1 Tax=Chromera velia CCMP2878 TaxID=1169474 RepID=A0A0G4HT62_9ALVE|eukprot:Cvel_8390.t1-p1 / transcript=Cvel_8390.t1 / gene=Cvel_8390 / organism=Chromera_velia_CCMP2878 / gene_product=hypothetical protein / transcript_product=hypothetical protein / location=Cvel_scaffold463:10893-11165(-) / protein_length=91 / sequence_SO=supercontig / SO=protein_coding / is_pseudo=false